MKLKKKINPIIVMKYGRKIEKAITDNSLELQNER